MHLRLAALVKIQAVNTSHPPSNQTSSSPTNYWATWDGEKAVLEIFWTSPHISIWNKIHYWLSNPSSTWGLGGAFTIKPSVHFSCHSRPHYICSGGFEEEHKLLVQVSKVIVIHSFKPTKKIIMRQKILLLLIMVEQNDHDAFKAAALARMRTDTRNHLWERLKFYGRGWQMIFTSTTLQCRGWKSRTEHFWL